MRDTNPDYSQIDPGLIQQLRGFRRALRVAELSELLATSDKTIYRLVGERRVPYFRVSGSIRFDPSALIEWLEGQGVK